MKMSKKMADRIVAQRDDRLGGPNGEHMSDKDFGDETGWYRNGGAKSAAMLAEAERISYGRNVQTNPHWKEWWKDEGKKMRGSGNKALNYCSICKGPHVYKHGKK